MEKYQRQSELYLTLCVIAGAILGYLDSKEFNFIYLLVFGIGIASISILVGIAIESARGYFFEEADYEDSTVLDNQVEQTAEQQLKEAKTKIISYRNKTRFAFFFALTMLSYELFINYFR